MLNYELQGFDNVNQLAIACSLINKYMAISKKKQEIDRRHLPLLSFLLPVPMISFTKSPPPRSRTTTAIKMTIKADTAPADLATQQRRQTEAIVTQHQMTAGLGSPHCQADHTVFASYRLGGTSRTWCLGMQSSTLLRCRCEVVSRSVG